MSTPPMLIFFMVQTEPSDHPAINVRVEGHTDTDGDDAHNLDLSQRRAESVVAYLAKQGIDRARLTAQGFGETQPIADNTTFLMSGR